MSARDDLIEAGATALVGGTVAENAQYFMPHSKAVTDSNLSDPALVIAALVECDECNGSGYYGDEHAFDADCLGCGGSGVDTAKREECLKALGLEQVGWQYAHDSGGPLVNLNQASACTDTRPVYAFPPSPDRETQP